MRVSTAATALAAALLALPALAEDAPVSLTASDGTGLRLVSYRARAVVEDPLAFTELALTFENPQDRVIEGQFRVTLPRGATVSRFAMKLDQRWQEGEVVEKQAARRAYEDFLHRRQDPALLEQAAGNEFSARVFPIPARGRKELIVSWSHELTSVSAPYVLPLRGLPQVEALDVEVFSGGVSIAKQQRARVVPDRDVSVVPPRAGRTGLRSGELVVTRVKAVAASQPEPVSSLLLLVDTSASRALGFTAQTALVAKLVERLAKASPAMPLTVACFDQSLQVIHDGPASGFNDAALKALRSRRPLGASDLSAALAWAKERGAKTPRARLVVVTDGVFTAGEVEGDQLLAAVSRLKDAGVQRLDAIAVGGIREEAVLRRLVTAKLPRTGTVLDGDQDAEVLVRRLGEATVAKVPVLAEGAKMVWPQALEGVQAGDEAVVFVELASASAAPKVTVGAASVDLSKGLASIERPLLQRAWAQAKIQALLDRLDRAADGPAQKQQVKDEIVSVSTRHRVLSPYTALLVLETEADYARFHIDRKALADILTVQNNRIGVAQRAPDAVAVVQKPPPLPKPREDVADKKLAPAKSLAKADEGDLAPQARAPDVSSQEEERALEKPKPEPAPSVAMPAPAAPPPPPPSRVAAEAPRPADSAPATRDRREAESVRPAQPRPPAAERMLEEPASGGRGETMPESKDPYEGRFKTVMTAVTAKQPQKALELAAGWREEQPGDVLALVALGEACEAAGDVSRAARAYGSIIDLFPSRADLRRFAGVRLERLKGSEALALAADSYAKAAEQRPDHPASHRLLAFALLRLGKPAKAFEAMERALSQRYPDGRFAGVDRILREDAGLVAAAWVKAQPGEAPTVRARLQKLGAVVEDRPSLRFVLTWETDANDVDFHIYDGKGGHASYQNKQLASGGELYADVTTGYGPECFTIRVPPAARAYPYKLRAHYYSRGPMGYGMGKLETIEHDGKGGLTFEERPYVVMVDQAFVDLGEVRR